jgi:hypothetical protein
MASSGGIQRIEQKPRKFCKGKVLADTLRALRNTP